MVWGACLYLLMAFSAGFGLGVVRTLWIAPALGPLPAVALEGPIMLAICWFACAAAIRFAKTGPGLAVRLGMGGLWFVLLQGCEIALGLALGQSLGAQLAHWQTADGALGLVWMAIAASFPALQRGDPAAVQ